MKSKIFGVILGLSLSMQGVMGLAPAGRPNLREEFKKSSKDADVVIQQVGNDLSVRSGKDSEPTIISLDKIVVGLLHRLKKQSTVDVKWLEQIENDLKQKNDEIQRLDNEFPDKYRAGPTGNQEETQAREEKRQKSKSDKKQAEHSRYDIYDNFLSNYSQFGQSNFTVDDLAVSDVGLFNEDGQKTVHFNLSIDSSINIRCYVDFIDPLCFRSRNNRLYRWYVVVFNTKCSKKIAIEADCVNIYNAKVKNIVAHSNKNVMVSFGQVSAECIKLLSYFNLLYGMVEQVDDITKQPKLKKIDPKDDCIEKAFKQILKVYRDIITPWGVRCRGLYCAKGGKIVGKNVETKGFDEVVLAGTVNVDSWYSGDGVRLGPNLESKLDLNTSLADWPNLITFNYLKAPWLSVNVQDHRSTTYWDYLSVDKRIKIKHLDPLTKENTIDMPSRPCRFENDKTSASQDQKNIMKILSGIEQENDKKNNYKSLSFVDNDNLINFLAAIASPELTEFLKSIGFFPEQVRNRVFKTTLQITDKNTGVTDTVNTVVIDGMPYFYWMYDNSIAWHVLNQSITDNLHICMKVLKKMLKDLGISVDDVFDTWIMANKANSMLQQMSEELLQLKGINLSETQYQNKIEALKEWVIKGIESNTLTNIEEARTQAGNNSDSKFEEEKEEETKSLKSKEEKKKKTKSLKDIVCLMHFLSDCGYEVNKVSDINTEDPIFQTFLNEFVKYVLVLGQVSHGFYSIFFKYEFIWNHLSDIFCIDQKSDINLIDLMSSWIDHPEQEQQHDEVQ